LVLAETLWVLQAVYNCTAAQLAAALNLLLEHQAWYCKTQKPSKQP
jgi:hypothetical protein